MVFVGVIKDFEMRRLSQIIKVGPKCSCIYPYKWEAEGALTHKEEEAV